MEFERYEDVIDAFERDNMGYETLTDYIKGENIKIAEIDMSPMSDLKKALGAKDGGMMIAIEQLGRGGITGGKTYHQYHDQFVPPDSESQMYANGGGVGSMMQPKKKSYKDQRLTAAEKKKIKPANQGGGPNYLGKQETVTVPKKWLSDPDHVVAELAYITPREQKILLNENIYGSLKGKPNKGPGGIMSLQGDLGGYDASPGGPNSGGSGSGGGGNRVGQVDKNKQRVQDILQGRVVTGQTAAKGPLTTRYGNTPEYVNVKQPDGTYKQTYVGSAYKSYGQPSFFQDLFSRGARGYRGIKGNPVFGNATKNLQMRDGPLGKGYYSDDENYGEIRDKIPFGLTGIIANMLEKFQKPPVDYSNMSEFNKLQNIDGKVIDPTGLELNKGAFGFPVNTNVTNQKPTANITGVNNNDFEIGDPGKYATADMINEFGVKAGTADDIGFIGMPGTADDRFANMYEDPFGNPTNDPRVVSEEMGLVGDSSIQNQNFMNQDYGIINPGKTIQEQFPVRSDFNVTKNLTPQGYEFVDNFQTNYMQDTGKLPNSPFLGINEALQDPKNYTIDPSNLRVDASTNKNQQTLENIINKDMYEKNLEPAINNQNKKNNILEQMLLEESTLT